MGAAILDILSCGSVNFSNCRTGINFPLPNFTKKRKNNPEKPSFLSNTGTNVSTRILSNWNLK